MIIIAEVSELTRKIKLPTDRVLSVNGDYQVDGIAFKLPATYEGDFDFSTAAARVHWTGVDKVEHTNLITEEDGNGYPLWVMPSELTQGGDGVIEFAVSFVATDETAAITKRWISDPVSFRNRRTVNGSNEDEEAEEETIYDRLASAIADVRAAQAEVEDTNAVLSSLTGSAPVPVENKSDMVDDGHLYLYTGDETGFVTGNLYYYVNGTLTNGGKYGSMEVDATLTKSGQAADAKKTGDEISQIKEDLSDVSALAGFKIESNNYQKGRYTAGAIGSSDSTAYCIFEGVTSGSKIKWNATKYKMNYFYLKSASEVVSIYTPNTWDTSGEVTLNYQDVGTVLIQFRRLDNSYEIAKYIDDINKTVRLFIVVNPSYIRWVAFGDSITHGSYSSDDGTTLNAPEYSYAYRIANSLWSGRVVSFANCGVRGIGWINTGNNGETFADMMAKFTGNKSKINLVTIMLGINDYNSLETLGTTTSEENDGTISGAIRYGLRYICENYPNAKVYAISPLNSMNHGSAATGWSRNTRLTNPGTLQNICDMIKYWADIYGVCYINEISDSFINNYNISSYLKDNLHPTSEGQWMLARELSRKIDV